jgi:arginine decarboxylase
MQKKRLKNIKDLSKEFKIKNDNLIFSDIELLPLIKKHGSPLKLTYLPKIGQQIQKAKNLFNKYINQYSYNGEYRYCYCTKSNHFSPIIDEVLNHNAHLETSSSYDIDIILNLYENKKITREIYIINNGIKTIEQLEKILHLYYLGFTNVIVVLDSKNELKKLLSVSQGYKVKIGLRLSTDNSRFGIDKSEIIDFYIKNISNNINVELNMLHFFLDTGISDSDNYWEIFNSAILTYTKINKICNSLDNLNIGGGFPINNNLEKIISYENIISKMIHILSNNFNKHKIKHPNIFTEFGKYTVAESGAIIYSIIEKKHKNKDCWYIINNSFMTTIPDSWTIKEKFVLLPINKWDNDFINVMIGGMSCDNYDDFSNIPIALPEIDLNKEDSLYIGVFNTGAYQDALSGYGGIKHCLIPSPKQIILYKDKNGNIKDYVFKQKQSSNNMLAILGYKTD